MSNHEIRFGTSGYRGIISETFTTAHVRAIAKGIVAALEASESEAPYTLMIGYDPRSGNSSTCEPGSFTAALIGTLSDHGVRCLFSSAPCPTPLLSWAIMEKDLDGGVMLTASHNPPEYNGIKFNTADGGPSPVEVGDLIGEVATEALAKEMSKAPCDSEADANVANGVPLDSDSTPPSVAMVEFTEEFASALIQKVAMHFSKTVDVSGISVVVDAKHGATGATWNALDQQIGFSNFDLLHAEPLSDFGSVMPNPTEEKGLDALRKRLDEGGFQIACSHDPDGDRHVILDETGKVLSPELCTAILAKHFSPLEVGLSAIASTLASSSLISVLCEDLGLEMLETAVGFKYFNAFLKQCSAKGSLGLAVESSGGFSTSFHTLEKCGFLPVLLMMGVMAERGLRLSELAAEIYAAYGRFYFEEASVRLDDASVLKSRLAELDRGDAVFQDFPSAVISIRHVDGTKCCFENGDWLLLRPSGTEPVLRIYAESRCKETVQTLLVMGQALIGQ